MKLVNPKGSVEKVKKLRSVRIVLVGAIILAALVGSFIVMFPYIKEMLLTNHTSGGEIRFLYVLGILAVAIILLIVVCVFIGGAIKKSDVGVEIDGGIAVCGCGREFAFGDLSWRVGQTRRETRSNDDSSRTTYETIGSIFIEAKCKKCGKVSNGFVENVVLDSSVSVTKHSIWNDKDVTTTTGSKTSGDEIKDRVLEAFGSARRSFNSTLNEYKKLGYKVAEENSGAVGKTIIRAVKI